LDKRLYLRRYFRILQNYHYRVGLKANYVGRYNNAEYDIIIKTNSLRMRDDREINFQKQTVLF